MGKIELHAHLSGCIRAETFLELCEKNKIDIENIDFYNMTFDMAFKVFSIINKIVSNLDILGRLVREMIEDYRK